MAIILFFYFIIAYSLSFLFVYSTGPFDIIERFRGFIFKLSPSIAKVFDCMYCFPTWVGLGLSLLNQFVITTIAFTPFCILFSTAPWYVILFLDVFVTNGIVYIIDCVTKILLNIKE